MSWRISAEDAGASMMIRHLDYPVFAALWTAGDGPEELAECGGLCWSDEGAGQGDQIHLYRFTWDDAPPGQAVFEALMRDAVREIDRYISGRLSD